MIIKPRRRGGFQKFSDYLNGEGDNLNENEECNFVATGNSLGIDSVNSWCIFANHKAELKRGGQHRFKKPIEHISIRTRQGDILKPEMIKARVPELIEALGYQNCPWLLVQHVKNGEPHYHLAICRIDDEQKIPNPKSYIICQELADRFARELGFKPAYESKNADVYFKKAAKLAGLWEDALSMKPEDRLQHFIKNGFLPAKGNRGQLVFVDKDAKPHTPQRIGAARDMGLKQKDMPGYFGLSVSEVRALPHCKKITAAITRKGWNFSLKRITKGFIHGFAKTKRYIRYHGNNFGKDFAPMSHMPTRHGVRLQIRKPDQFLPPRTHGIGFQRDQGLQPIRRTAGIDPIVHGRAQAAYDGVFAEFAAKIDAVKKDKSLTPDQRTAAIMSLRLRQMIAANAARKKIIEEGKQNAKTYRRYLKGLMRKPI